MSIISQKRYFIPYASNARLKNLENFLHNNAPVASPAGIISDAS